MNELENQTGASVAYVREVVTRLKPVLNPKTLFITGVSDSLNYITLVGDLILSYFRANILLGYIKSGELKSCQITIDNFSNLSGFVSGDYPVYVKVSNTDEYTNILLTIEDATIISISAEILILNDSKNHCNDITYTTSGEIDQTWTKFLPNTSYQPSGDIPRKFFLSVYNNGTLISTENKRIDLESTNRLDLSIQEPTPEPVEIPLASSDTVGGFKVGTISEISGLNQYPVKMSAEYAYVEVPIPDADIHRFSDMSDAPTNQPGLIVQYIGPNSEEYTKGYFYQFTPTEFTVDIDSLSIWYTSENTGKDIADYNINLDYLITTGNLSFIHIQENDSEITDASLFSIVQNDVELVLLTYADLVQNLDVRLKPEAKEDYSDENNTLTLTIDEANLEWKQKNVLPLLKVGSPLVYMGPILWANLQLIENPETGLFYTVTDKSNQEYFWNGSSWEFMGDIVTLNGKYLVKVGNTEVSRFEANLGSDTNVTFESGLNISITPDATNHLITISANGYTFESEKEAIRFGKETEVTNLFETAFGTYNSSNSNDNEFGDAKNTHFSIGIGRLDEQEQLEGKNAVEVTLNGDVFVLGLGEYKGTLTDESEPKSLQEVINSIPAQVNADWNSNSGLSLILNKPTIPAALVNADWNAVSGVAQILNKPTIPVAQIQSDWNLSDNTAKDYIKNKPTDVSAFNNDAGYLTSQVQTDWNANSGVGLILNKPNFVGPTSITNQVYYDTTIPTAVVSSILVSGTNNRYNWAPVNNDVTMSIDTATVVSGTSEVVYAIKNTHSTDDVVLKLPSAGHNMIGESSLTIGPSKIAEIVFTFWPTNPMEVSFNGGKEW